MVGRGAETQAPFLADSRLSSGSELMAQRWKTGDGNMAVKAIVAASALAIGFGALWASPGVATNPAAPAATGTQPKAAANDTSRRACRNLVRSGTRLSTRYCRTQAEWDQAADGARRLLQEGQEEGSFRDGQGFVAPRP
jgi:hypothetical protein